MSEILKFLPSHKRGKADYGWLKTSYSFSFAEYYNPDWMQFGPLRVINEDIILPGGAFPRHGHKNAEIMTYVLKGNITHEDEMGNVCSIGEGEFQFMSAGRGIFHSESNKSLKVVHLFQIWVQPNVFNTEPFYQNLSPSKKDEWSILASNDAAHGVPVIKQNVRLYVLNSENINSINLPNIGLHWMQVAKGRVEVMQKPFKAGDGVGFISDQFEQISITEPSTLLLFYFLD